VDLASGFTTVAVTAFFLQCALILFLLFCDALSYGFYHLAARTIPFHVSQINMGTIQDIVMGVAGSLLYPLLMYVPTLWEFSRKRGRSGELNIHITTYFQLKKGAFQRIYISRFGSTSLW